MSIAVQPLPENARETGRPPSWRSLYAANAPEADAALTDTQGTLPSWLRGTLYRNGPTDTQVSRHLFDGDGLLRAFHFAGDGSVRYRARYAQTQKRALEQRSGKPEVQGFGTLHLGGHLRDALQQRNGNCANTNLLPMGDKLLALWEGGLPFEIDPLTLASRGEYDFAGALPKQGAFSAHPRRDSKTGEWFNFGLSYARTSRVFAMRVDARGQLQRLGKLTLPRPLTAHDCVLTPRWFCVVLPPLTFNPLRLLSGVATLDECLRFDSREASLIAMFPRDGGSPFFVEAPALFAFHCVGAREDGTHLRLQLCRMPDFTPLGQDLRDFRRSDFSSTASQALWELDVDLTTRRVREQCLLDVPCDFPNVSPTVSAGAYTQVFMPSNTRAGEGGMYRALTRFSLDAGLVDRFDFGPDAFAGEATLISEPSGAPEQGLLALVVHHVRGAWDELVVLDALRVAEGPVFRARMPVSIGFCAHGSFVAL